MVIGRNAPCPCGSGKKFKKCCWNEHVPPNGNQAFQVGQPRLRLPDTFQQFETQFREYLRAQRELVCDLDNRDEAQVRDYLDGCYANLNWDRYSLILREIKESRKLMLLPAVAPDLLEQALEIKPASASLMPLIREIEKRREYENYDRVTLLLYETEIGNALNEDDYSFNAPPREPFPVLIERVPSGGYAPQFVTDYRLFSPTIKRQICIPVLFHSCGSHLEFSKRSTFVHEIIHVLQRVFRKHRVPAYPYSEDGHAKVRNPETYVQVGIDDELEVQKIMVAAGYKFSLDPILFHQKNLTAAFKDMDRDEVHQSIRAGIEQIAFQKYDGLYEGNLRDEIIRTFINEV